MDFVDSVLQMLKDAGVPPERLHLEVTETALSFNAEMAVRVIGALSAQGISLAIDDFGVGYTSLSQLRMVGVSEIKIDKTFVTGLPANEQDCAIARSVIDLGHSLGCLVTAEGVESQDIADWLEDAGCDHAQGYLWLRPSPWLEVAHTFATTSTNTTTASGVPTTKDILA
jgi:EAL domain-containing protein (putative c-di-GMP-specific phosphodiesterase class I)